MFGPCLSYAVLSVLSIFRNHLHGEERAGCFTLIFLLTFCDCSVAPPHGCSV